MWLFAYSPFVCLSCLSAELSPSDMSSSLVRKALELLETEHVDRARSVKNDSRQDLKKRRKSTQVQLRILGDVKSEAALQVEIAKRTTAKRKDRTRENLKCLAVLGNTTTADSKKAQKIFERTVKSKRPVDDTAPDSSASAFTEEDFRKFEEEYFVS
ncbi:Active regulator of SIRT1 [Frankliniella fusca]|uniref:Active regulator of SIRT1 n=1 Tax=Frankliniella fusca TaxID=407009 RepID=A0AAE1H8E5_9NEOP|nr:Active regulator of SIRT1 [Frankliniella fusca]